MDFQTESTNNFIPIGLQAYFWSYSQIVVYEGQLCI